MTVLSHDGLIKWKHFPRYCPFMLEIHRSPVNSPHKSQWRGTLMFSLIRVWINDWVNNREAGYLRCHRTHYDVTAMTTMAFPMLVSRHFYIDLVPNFRCSKGIHYNTILHTALQLQRHHTPYMYYEMTNGTSYPIRMAKVWGYFMWELWQTFDRLMKEPH